MATNIVDPSAAAKASPKFSKFNITTTPYKIVNGQEIPVHVFLPKTIQPGPRPIIARFHGGFLITGAALFPDFTAQWALDYCLQHSAIWLAPDYRLLPESSGLEILSDLADFWLWVQDGLPAYLARIGSPATPDLSKVLAYGESAGGYLALQTALTQANLVKAAIAAFPMVDVDAAWYSEKIDGQSPFGAPAVPETLLDEHVAQTPRGRIAVAGFPPDRIPLALLAIQQGVFTDLLGDDDSLYPLRVLDRKGADERVPFVFTFHGTEDRAVPHDGTKRFVEQWEEKFGKGGIYSVFGPGDHGLDGKETLETEWLREGLKGVTRAWLGQ